MREGLMILWTRFGAESENPDFESNFFLGHIADAERIGLVNGIAMESSSMREILSPSIQGSIRRQNACWWNGAITPSLTFVHHGTVVPGSIDAVDKIPVAWIL